VPESGVVAATGCGSDDDLSGKLLLETPGCAPAEPPLLQLVVLPLVLLQVLVVPHATQQAETRIPTVATIRNLNGRCPYLVVRYSRSLAAALRAKAADGRAFTACSGSLPLLDLRFPETISVL